jgi:chaperonin GroES
MSKLNPLNGYVVLKPVEEGETTYGNIVLPDLGKEKPEMGEVVETSPTYNWHKGENVPSALEVGDKVLIPKLGSMKITVEGEDYFITKESEVLAKLS